MALRQVAAAVFLPLFILFNAASAFAQTIDNYEYDALGRLVKVTTQGGHNHGHASDYHYDPAGNRSSVNSTGSPVVPGFSVSGTSASEGSPLVFTVTLADASAAASVSYATANGSAAAGADYTAVSGTLNFAPGETSKTISVATASDLLGEGDETVQLLLSAPTGATLRTASATGTIVDVALGSFSVAGASASEGSGLVFTVSRTGVTTIAASVGYSSSNGSATAGSDYTAVSGTLSFAAGETSKTITVNTATDLVVEGDETVQVTLSSPIGGVIGTGAATGTISDVPPGSFSVAATSANEGSGLVFTVTRTGDTGVAASVGYGSSDGTATAGSDYVAVSGTLSFAPGETSKTITVDTTTDVAAEADETVQMTLSSPVGAVIGTGSATGMIVDVPTGSLSIADAYGDEGQALVFTVTRTGVTNIAASVSYATSDGTATAGTDYTAASGTLTFAPGETSKTITVTSAADTPAESNETFQVTLSAPSGAVLGRASAQGAIIDRPMTMVWIGDTQAYEGDAVVFSVSRSGLASATVSVNYATADGTAIAGSDYTPVSGTLTFAAGEATKTVSVSTLGDLLGEGSETFQLVLSSPVGGMIGTGTGTATLTDPPYGLTIQSASGNEGDALVFNVSRTGLTDRAVSFGYATSDLTATAGADYTAASGTISFAAGETAKTISVVTATDPMIEADETFRLTLSTPGGPVTATGTVRDVPADTLSVAATTASAVEGSPVTFTVTRTGPAAATSKVNYAVSPGTATSADYIGVAGQLTFAPGETAKTISVTTTVDSIEEGDETFLLTLSQPIGAKLGVSTATGTIVNGAGPDSLSVTGGSATEGSPVTFTVTRTGAATGTATVSYRTSEGTAGSLDYSGAFDTLTFAPGEMSKTISIATKTDTEDEADETFTLTLSQPTGAVINTASATGSITNIGLVWLSGPWGSEATKMEGIPIVFTVTRSGPFDVPATVAYATSDGTAVAGSDYVATSGTLSFAAGEASKTISVPTLADTDYAEVTENLTLTISSPTGLLLGSGTTGTVNIANSPGYSVSDASAYENSMGVTFTVTRVNTTGFASFKFATSDLTATAGLDYTAKSGTGSFSPGNATATVTINFKRDTLVEGDETFLLTVTPSTGLFSSGPPVTAIGTIIDIAVISVGDATASEGSNMIFTVTRSGVTNVTSSVQYVTFDGTAKLSSDYIPQSGTVTFAPGETSKTVAVPIRTDALTEGNETMQLRLSSPVNSTIDVIAGTGTIIDVVP